MDVIANVIAFILSFVAGVIGNIVAHDICVTSDARCKKIIARATARLAPFDRAETEKEWLGDLSERETAHAKYYHAIGCYLAAPQMRRQATTIKINVSFRVPPVGTVPLIVTIDPIFGAAFLNRTNGLNWLSKYVLAATIIYYFCKVLLAAHRLGPGCLRRFLNDTKNFKKWDVDVKATRKGLELDFSKHVKLWLIDKKRGTEAFKRVAEIFEQTQSALIAQRSSMSVGR
jgi:hypothetical protein